MSQKNHFLFQYLPKIYDKIFPIFYRDGYQKIAKFIEAKALGKDFIGIDYGCGSGRFLPYWPSSVKEVKAYDVSEAMLNLSASTLSPEEKQRISFRHIKDFAFSDVFDGQKKYFFVLNSVYSVIKDREYFLKELSENLPKDSYAILTFYCDPRPSIKNKALTLLTKSMWGYTMNILESELEEIISKHSLKLQIINKEPANQKLGFTVNKTFYIKSTL